MSKKTYFAQVEGMINGAHHKVNDELPLTEREAKYLVMGGLVATEKKVVKTERAEPSPVDLDMKTRKI
jgi:hypothetical protein